LPTASHEVFAAIPTLDGGQEGGAALDVLLIADRGRLGAVEATYYDADSAGLPDPGASSRRNGASVEPGRSLAVRHEAVIYCGCALH
jgi:hypothetical protein